MPGHARLTSGRWAVPGASPVQATLAEPAARLMGRAAGDRIPLADRRHRAGHRGGGDRRVAAARTPATRTGGWRRVRDRRRPQSSTYGPFVVDRADFATRFAASASAAWLIEPALAGASLEELARVAAAADGDRDALPAPSGLDQSGVATTGLTALAARLPVPTWSAGRHWSPRCC